MPIPVRCAECDKGLRIPDKYAGRTVKCPACKAPLAVPAAETAKAGSGGSAAKQRPARSKSGSSSSAGKPNRRKQRVAPPPESDSDFLADLDLDRLGGSGEVSICPRCATPFDELSSICPNCGYDHQTGQLDQKFVRKKQSKGPVASEFYKEAPGEAKDFTFSNMLLVKKTAVTWTVFGIMAAISYRFLEYVQGLPTYVFWACMTSLCIFAIAGWFWSLGGLVMTNTMAREKSADRISVDFFATLAIGVRAVLWPFIVGLPIYAVLGVLLATEMISQEVFVITASVLYAVLYLLFPIAQVHRMQKYSFKASILWELLRIVPAVFGPLAFYVAIAAVCIAPFAGIAYAVHEFGGGINPVSNEYIRSGARWVAEKTGELMGSSSGEEGFVFTSIRRIVTVILAIPMVAAFMVPAAFPAVFLMRLNGLFGLYNARRLGLIGKMPTGTPATAWVRILAGCVDGFAIPFTSFIVVNEKLAVILGQLLNGLMVATYFTGGIEAVLLFLPAWLAYNGWMYYSVSEATTARATIGKETYGLLVIPEPKPGEDPEDYGQLTLKQASIRTVAAGVLGFIGLLMIPFDEEGRSLVDKITNTRVIFRGDR